MKFILVLTAMLLAAALAGAQAAPAAGQAQTPSPAPPPSPTSASPSPATTPSSPPQSTAPGSPAAQTAPAAGSHRVLQAKSQEELKAYQDASALTDPAQVQAAADAFAAKYPTSELRAALYVRAMNLYAQANNTEKVIATGRQAIAADPVNPVPLVQVASALAEWTRDSDLDREQRLAEAAKDAHAALDNIDTGLLVPANLDPARLDSFKQSITTMAYDVLGTVDMDRNDFGSAVKNLQKAIDESRSNPEAVLYLRLSVAQDKLKDYSQALDSANKAVQYAKDGTQAQNLAKVQQARLQKLISAGSGAEIAPPASAPPGAAPQPVPGASSQPPVPASPSTPR